LLFEVPYAARNVTAYDAASDSNERIYYSLSILDEPKPLPHIQPRGAGAHPDEGQFPHLRPALGSTATNPALAAVSKPLRPDNKRQTIVQPSSPPDLVIRTELKLPNIVEGMIAGGPKTPSQLYASLKPVAPNRPVAPVAPPTLTVPTPTNPL